MYSTSWCSNPTYLCRPANYPISWGVVKMLENGKLRKLGWTYHHGTMFAPRQCLHQKKATGMESQEMYSTGRCRNPTYLCGPVKYPV